MRMDVIEEGDCVNVYFTCSNAIFNALVKYKPAETGDCWTLVQKDVGQVSNVMIFERMDLVAKKQ